MMHGRLTLLPLAAALLAGCVTDPAKNVAEYDDNVTLRYPSLSLYQTQLPPEQLSECREYDQSSALNYCLVNDIDGYSFVDSIRDSRLFEQVYAGQEGGEYELYISTARYKSEGAEEIAAAAFSGATLLLVPTEMSSTVKANLTLAWREIPIKTYQYELPHVHTLSLFHDPNASDSNFAKSLFSHFMKDAQQDDAFSQQFLQQALSSSNYSSELTLPQQIHDFSRLDTVIQRDPLQGVDTWYQHPDYSDDQIHLNIRPIPRTEWDEMEAVLVQALTKAQKSVEIEAMEQQFNDVQIQDVTFVSSTQKALPGAYLSVSMTDNTGEPLHRSIFVYANEDKLIQFTTNFPPKWATPRITEAVDAIEVPGESLFIAKLRQQHR
ncbi:hypothetical protein KUV89_05760 [Marinobacter hydrocarbonoclasticus]|nr:hypothetical protein [Marinobacter nauticus]